MEFVHKIKALVMLDDLVNRVGGRYIVRYIGQL